MDDKFLKWRYRSKRFWNRDKDGLIYVPSAGDRPGIFYGPREFCDKLVDVLDLKVERDHFVKGKK